MDIRSAAHYLKNGYRIKRTSWSSDSYMKASCTGELEQFHKCEYWTLGKDENGLSKTVKHEYLGGGLSDINIDDLLADDWELILTGIRKEFSKHEHGMEYDDDTDWDNYVAPKSSWDGDDEDE